MGWLGGGGEEVVYGFGFGGILLIIALFFGGYSDVGLGLGLGIGWMMMALGFQLW